MKKYFLALIICTALLLPAVSHAVAVEDNPQCWTESGCTAQRASSLGDANAGNGWVEGEGECSQAGWGKCLAGAITKTQISFGGSNSFSNVGDYIKTVYNYGLVILGILAVVMIIISGTQWIASAGSSEKITQAKKRLSGAVIGLVIAYMSYIILKSINPATVNLRLPQVWLLRTIAVSPIPCLSADGVAKTDVLTINSEFFTSYKKAKPSTTLTSSHTAAVSETKCGVVYNLPNGDKCRGASCKDWEDAKNTGRICGAADWPCACFFDDTSQLNYCTKANIGGTINMHGTQSIDDWYADYIVLQYVCKMSDNTYQIFFAKAADPDEDNKDYALLESTTGRCSHGIMAGYFLTVEVNDASTASITTDDDNWVVGKKSCGSGGKPIATYLGEVDLMGGYHNGSQTGSEGQALMKAMEDSGNFWTADEIKNGVSCDLDTKLAPYNAGVSDDQFRGGVFFLKPSGTQSI